MWTWFDKLDIQILDALTCGRLRYLYLTLYNLLFLLFQLIDKIGCQFENDCDEAASDTLVHEILELYLLCDKIDCCTSLVEQARVEAELGVLRLQVQGFGHLKVYLPIIRRLLPLSILNIPPFELSKDTLPKI